MKVHLRSRHFKDSCFLGAVSGEPEAIKSHGDPIQRSLLEAYPGATKIKTSVNFCILDNARYDMLEYTDFQYQADVKAAKVQQSNDIIHTINLIQITF